jgi:hypothetical protein
MAAPTNTPSTEDIWQLNIEDLFAPLPEKARLGGPGPFVINLIASSAPIEVPAKGIAGCPHAHVYQVQRIEDRRPRYRLRLGPFTQEDDADAELLKVRDIYPSALTATADADDMRIIAALQAKAPLPPSPARVAKQTDAPMVPTLVEAVAKQAEAPMVPTLVEAVAKQAEAPMVPTLVEAVAKQVVAPLAPTPVKAAATQVEAPMVLTLVEEVAVPAETPAMRPSVPTPPLPKPAVARQASPAVVTVAAPATLMPQQKPAVRAPVRLPPEQPTRRALSLESTQTIRALTQLELEDDEVSRWFAIQLSLAEEAFDPETLPNLDIFRVYRLYSVAGIDQGRIVHALRLGFFTEEVAAGAVASYLAAFYDKPTIKRVSSAERERFAEQSLEARKDVGTTGKQAVIEITNERYIRENRVGQAAAK